MRSLLLLAALVLVVLPAAAQPLFPFDAPWAAYNTGTNVTSGDPVAIATGDFDFDGDPDVVTARGRSSAGGSGFSFLRNDGRGRLGAAVLYASTSNTSAIAAADFDGDGALDVAVSNSNALTSGNTVSVFPGNGDGTFGTPQNVSVGTGNVVPVGLAPADFDADGDTDLAVAAYGYVGGGSTVVLLQNDGTGGFAAPVTFPAGAAPYRLAVGDLTGDGRPDLAVANNNYQVTVLRNDAAGGFDAPVAYAGLGNEAYNIPLPTVALADVDGDGDLDVFYANNRTRTDLYGHIVQLRNDGTGALTRAADIPLMYYTTGPTDLAAADLDDDGDPDLVANQYSARTSDGVIVILNDGAGTFLPAVRYSGGQATYAVAAADMDADGDADVLTTDDYSMAVTVRLNPGNGFFPAIPDDFAASVQYYLDAADLDGDGDLDVFTSGAGPSAAQGAVLLNDGAGRFPDRTDVTVPVNGVAFGVLRDLNNDGRADLLFNNVGTAPSSKFYVALNNGDGSFPAPTVYPVASAGWGHIDAFDLDGDGDLDVVDMEALGGPGVPPGRFFVYLNQGDGTLVPGTPYDQLPGRPDGVAGGDFDHDGDADLAMTRPGAYGFDYDVMVVLGNGDGTFGPPIIYPIARGPNEIVTADLDGDGHLDLAVGSAAYDDGGGSFLGEEKLTLLFGTGTGTFTSISTYYAPYSPDLLGSGGLRAGDIDRDGDLDVMLQAASNDVSIYRNEGGRTFSFPYRIGFGATMQNPYYGDFTGDGVPDLAAVVHRPPLGFDAGVAVLRGVTGTPTAEEPQTPGAPSPTPALALSAPAPNPARGSARFTLTLAAAQAVRVEAFDALGRRVALLHDGELAAGPHVLTLDASTLAPGVYVVRGTGVSGARASHRFVVAR